MVKALVAALLIVLVVGALCWAGPESDTSRALIDAVNAQRRAHALPPLVLDARLAKAAAEQAGHLAATGRLDHEGADGSRVGDRVARAGYRWARVAENLERSGARSSPRAVVVRWMESPPHRRNLLDPNVRHAGGAQVDSVWVLVMAAPR